jgi:ketosteroid isomerase-like protein
MSQENVEIVRRTFQEFMDLLAAIPGDEPATHVERYGDVPALIERFESTIEWDFSRFVGWPEEQVYYGHEGLVKFWRAYLSAWGSIVWDLDEFFDAGDQVVVFVRQRARGRTSGVDTEYPPYAQLWTLRDGKIVRFAAYSERDEALEAAGLRA